MILEDMMILFSLASLRPFQVLFLFPVRGKVGFWPSMKKKKTTFFFQVLICSVKLWDESRKKRGCCRFSLAKHNSADLRTHFTQFSISED